MATASATPTRHGRRGRGPQSTTPARATVLGKDSADAELKKFYEAVLPPDLSAARRLLFGSIEKLAAAAGVKLESETLRDQRAARRTTSPS